MAETYLTPKELHEHLSKKIAVKTLANWRCDELGRGPRFRRMGNKILYPLAEVEKWEQAQEFATTHDYGKKQVAA